LEAARCKKCDKTFFPPRRVCSNCNGREFDSFAMKRTGTVLTHTVIRTPAPEYSGEAPFAVGIVQMDDGPRLTTQIVDVDLNDIKIGMSVKLEFRRNFEEGEAGILQYGHKAVPRRD
jgi:uncharacterized OB-fold protein